MQNVELVTVKELGFAYPGAPQKTLSGVSFSLRQQQIYGFLGPSGAGKSTTQKVLYGLLRGYTGSVSIADREIRDCGGELYHWIGVGFETPNLYLKLTGRENLEFGLALRESRSRFRQNQTLPSNAQLHRPPGDRTIHPVHGMNCAYGPMNVDAALSRLGLSEVANGRVETYSKGMRMRLAFIRAILHRPSLLFLDEPTSGLDPLWAREVKNWILELRSEGTAVFLTTHSMELADELCDTVGFLVDGRLVAQDNPTVLKQRHGRPGVTVYGVGKDGKSAEIDVAYHELLQKPLSGLSQITRVVNREVTLEQVFLQMTGRRLADGADVARVSA